MTNSAVNHRDRPSNPAQAPTSQCIDWYAQGESREVECNGVRVTIRFVGRKGRRGRISIEAPPGAVFRSPDGDETRGER